MFRVMETPPLLRVGACLLAFAAFLFASTGADAATRDFHGKPRGGGAYLFKLAGIASGDVQRARLSSKGRHQGVAPRRVKNAAARGRLRLRPRGALARCARTRCKLKLRVWLRYDAQATVSRDARACAFGDFGIGNWPGPCWRPYADDSPFNRRLPASPPIAANSSDVVGKVASWGRPLDRLSTNGADDQTDYGHPYYFSRPSDPKFTVTCAEDWGKCPIEGHTIHIPDSAKPANGPDGHMAVIDQANGWEYDFFQVRRKPNGGGRLVTSWGGRTRIGTPDATGLGGMGTASSYGLLAGVIRAPEAASLEIDHALFMFVKCTSGKVVYPAKGTGQLCSQIGGSNQHAPAMGTHFQLDMTDAEIDALGAPPLQTAVLRAMAHYGLYVGDTGGDPWNILFESDATYTNVGRAAQVRSTFRQLGARHYQDDTYDHWVLDTVPVDWERRLRVVDPCFAQGTCG
jgi:hypothetical protein